METLKKPSLEKSEKAFTQEAIISTLLLDVVSDTNPSECHNPSDSNGNVAQNVVVNGAESAPVETQQDHLSGRCFVSCMHCQWSVVFNETIHTLVLDDATMLSLNCDISKTQYCNRTLVAETIISCRRLYHINSDNHSTIRL